MTYLLFKVVIWIWVNEEGDGWKQNGKVMNNVTVGAYTEAYGEGTLFSLLRAGFRCIVNIENRSHYS